MRTRIFWLGVCLLLAPAAQAAPVSPATQMIACGAHSIAAHVIAGRQPALVLDAGGGNDSSYWTSLIPQLAKATGSEIITYDRSGFGASPEVAGPWNVMTARDDLIAVIKATAGAHKVVLVSHSLAGEIALYAAKEHPRWFMGVVLVDANVPQFYTDAVISAAADAYKPLIARAKAGSSEPSNRQLLALSASFVKVSRAFHRAKWPVSVPVAVIVSETTPIDEPHLAAAWRSSHSDFAKAAPNRTLVTAAKSSHDVAHDRPDVVISAVSAFVAKARQGD